MNVPRRLLALYLATWLAMAGPGLVLAQDDLEVSIQLARTHIRDNRFDDAIAVLEETIDLARGNDSTLREVYLLLIKAYVSGGNYHTLQSMGRTTSELFYNQAEDLVRECLGIYALRHTTATPAEEFPPEVHEMIQRVRREMFGSLNITAVDPADAIVFLDGIELSPDASGSIRETDVRAGEHELRIHREGYRELDETLVIAPASTLERQFQLDKNRGWLWWGSRVAMPITVVAGVIIALAGGSSDETPEEPLPGAPPPPGP